MKLGRENVNRCKNSLRMQIMYEIFKGKHSKRKNNYSAYEKRVCVLHYHERSIVFQQIL